MNNITVQVPYMVMPGNHEASCAEYDMPPYELTAYLVDNKTTSSSATDNLTYYSCPPSQRYILFHICLGI